MVFGSADGTIRTWHDDLTHRQIMEKCAQLRDGEQWTDPSFPADDPRTIYVTGHPASGKPYGNGKIRWLRPHEVKGADMASLALIKDGVDAGDVVQGELGDCYLLGAMSSIAAKDLLGPIIETGGGAHPLECIRRGFMSFRLYKFGEWQEVSVDTLLPCNEQNEPIFAHGKDPNELWVCLLEKAYAKLHGSYEALDGGSVTAALVDLTGGVGESIDMTDEDTVYEIADGSFWKRLKRYATKDVKKLKANDDPATSGQYLLGAALSQSSVPDQGAHESMQVTDLGILVNHAYSLTDVAEIGEAHQEKIRLVQLRNPWGLKEWEGPWSDNSREWDTAVGRKAMQKLNVSFDGADGTFWMAWEDFQAHFNKIYVCRIFETVNPLTLRRGERPPLGAWCRYEIEGAWDEDNSGGCFNFPEWRKNPQYEIRTSEMTDAVFLLMQKDPRTDVAPHSGSPPPAMAVDGSSAKLGGDEGGPKYDKKIGMYVMRGHEIYRRKVLFDSDEMEGEEVTDSTPYMAYREVTCNTMDEEDDQPLQPYERYVMIPSTFEPGKTGKFRIVLYTAKPLEHPPELVPRLKECHVAGAWTESNAGGCRNFYTWRRNEQYSLQLSKPARVSVVLLRHNAEVSDTALHSKKSKAKAGSKKKKAKDASNFLIGFVVARAGPRPDRKQLHVEAGEIVDKTQFSPAFESAAEFYSEDHLEKAPERSYVIVPSTFEPGIDPPNPAKWGDFELLVFTDDERAVFSRIEPSTWHMTTISGEWSENAHSAGGCRNYPTWVRNPLYTLRASRAATCQLFLRQPTREDAPDEPAEYPGIGFYVTVDDGSLSLDDVRCESGFRQLVESHATVDLSGDTPYLIIPMTYRRNVSMPFTVEVYCDQPSCRVEMLPKGIADERREDVVRHEAARTITRALLVHRLWSFLRRSPPDRERAHAFMVEWFRKPVRFNDEGFLNINLALNALESAYIQLTGKADMKGKFFPQMRERLRHRGHKIADYDVCL